MKAFSYINVLSLDVVLGAVSCSLFLSSQWQVNPSWQSLALLGCVVWLIYTFDHLKDVYGRTIIPQTARHVFHARNFTSLIVASIVVLSISLLLMLQVNEKVLRFGMTLIVLVGIYFLLLHFLKSHARYHKELAIAVLYAAGICIPCLGAPHAVLTADQWIHFAQFAGLALGNLLCFSLFEYNSDRRAGFPSLIQVFSPPLARHALMVFLGIQVAGSLILYVLDWYPLLQVSVACMAAILLLLAGRFSSFSEATFRLTGDAVFVIPLLFYLLQ